MRRINRLKLDAAILLAKDLLTYLRSVLYNVE